MVALLGLAGVFMLYKSGTFGGGSSGGNNRDVLVNGGAIQHHSANPVFLNEKANIPSGTFESVNPSFHQRKEFMLDENLEV